MSSAPNPSPRPSQASSAESQPEVQPNSAPPTSSPAETMTDQNSNSLLITPPTRMTSSDPAGADQPTPELVETAPTASTPVTPDPTVASGSASPAAEPTPKPVAPRHQPIPPASEPMQYRAIGLVRGKYEPSEEQFTRGALITEDGVQIDAVLLGRVMSLVKKHIDLAESHLWVVYPRTREKGLDLHMQIVGVWEPEKLNRTVQLDDSGAEDADSETEESEESEAAAETADDSALKTLTLPSPDELDDRYFSVRGEVVYQSEEEDRLLIKIRRAPKPGSTQAKAFKVALKGKLTGKGLGYFWDFQVQRESNDLVITEATQIGIVPPTKRGAGGGGGGRRPGGRGGPPRRGGPGSGPPRKRWQDREGGQSSRPQRDRGERGERPQRPMPSGSSQPRQPISKPVKRPKPEEG